MRHDIDGWVHGAAFPSSMVELNRRLRMPPCGRSNHPSREELARRKARRTAKREALVDETRPEAAATLDAFLLHRAGASARFDDDTKAMILDCRLEDFRRAALYEFNRVNQTRHRHPVDMRWLDTDGEIRQGVWICLFCEGRLGGNRISGIRHSAHSYVVRHFPEHLTQCALEYLAGLRRAPALEGDPSPPTPATAGRSRR